MITPKTIIYHVVANPKVPTNPKYAFDPFTSQMIRFCKLLHDNGHIVYFYGCSGCEEFVDHTKYFSIINKKYYDKLEESTNNLSDPRLLTGTSPDVLKSNLLEKIEKKFYKNLIEKINENYSQYDMVCHFFENLLGGYKYKNIIHIQPMQFGGYWEGYLYMVCATDQWYRCITHNKPSNNLLVTSIIHPWFYKNDYTINKEKWKDTFLYLARISNYKGFDIFLRLVEKFPRYNFIVAGGCTKYDEEEGILYCGEKEYHIKKFKNLEYVGVVYGEKKRELLANVSALIQPTAYFEPCGLNAIEAMMSGTPVLATKFGGYCDTIINNVTGFLCNLDRIKNIGVEDYSGSLDDWINVLENKIYLSLNNEDIYNYAHYKFDPHRAYTKYYDFFERVLTQHINLFRQ